MGEPDARDKIEDDNLQLGFAVLGPGSSQSAFRFGASCQGRILADACGWAARDRGGR